MDPITWIRTNVTAAIGGVLGLGLVALGIWCFILSHQVHARTQERDLAIAQRDAEVTKHAVTRQSLDVCLGSLDAKNAESEARAKAYDDAKAADAKDVAAADSRYAAEKARRDTLGAIAKAAAARPGGCAVPDALTASLEGL